LLRNAGPKGLELLGKLDDAGWNALASHQADAARMLSAESRGPARQEGRLEANSLFILLRQVEGK
jgi:hypothetical protein